jgi:copper chaperone
MMTLEIKGMTCGHCQKAVTQALASVPGVQRVVSVEVATGRAVIEGEPSLDAVVSTLREAGYESARVS